MKKVWDLAQQIEGIKQEIANIVERATAKRQGSKSHTFTHANNQRTLNLLKCDTDVVKLSEAGQGEGQSNHETEDSNDPSEFDGSGKDLAEAVEVKEEIHFGENEEENMDIQDNLLETKKVKKELAENEEGKLNSLRLRRRSFRKRKFAR